MFSKAWIKLGLVVAAAGGMIGLLAYGFTRDARYFQSPLVARQAPSFTLTLFDGKTIRLEDFRGSSPYQFLGFVVCPVQGGGSGA
jgi:cytochrome oxidase Cu insertion factor (SCO1/SenC/PrrC family)